MKKQIIISLIILSFIAPALHFIEHNHSYNPFAKKLEHQNPKFHATFKLTKNKNSEIETSNKNNSENDICQVEIFNEFLKNDYYTPYNFNQIFVSYAYKFNIYQKITKSNKIIFIAPKNSPPFLT